MSAANTLPFRTFAPWLRETFGRPMYRVALDAGSTCPNRDGSRGFGGCVYCDVEGSGTGALRTGEEIARQLETGLKRIARRDDDCGCIAYLQSYSNTYVEASRLEEVLAPIEIAIDEGKVGIVSIATRPDTLPDWSLDRLSKLAERVPVWVELGLESANDEVLEKIKRYHTAAEFMEGVRRCHAAGLKTVGHAILGLPGDGREGARKSAELLAEAGCEGVKVHNLMVLRKTELAKWWRDGKVDVLDPETYVSWLADFTERLLPNQVLHRITGDAPLDERLAPRWDLYKNAIREMLAAELEKRGTVQGSLHA